ncbi:hypothetical protein HAX54_042530, partial [Datura stramonium]|nr:hypothetical protein [Datura stramonium]
SYPFSLNDDGGANPTRKTHIGLRDNHAQTDDFHHVKCVNAPLSALVGMRRIDCLVAVKAVPRTFACQSSLNEKEMRASLPARVLYYDVHSFLTSLGNPPETGTYPFVVLVEAAVIQRMQALSGMIRCKVYVGGFLSPPSNPRAQSWTGGGNYQAGVR